MSNKKTKMTLQQIKALIFPAGKYFDKRKQKLMNTFGTNKKTKGGKLILTKSFKTWLRMGDKGITKEEREQIMLDATKKMNQYNAKAEETGQTPDKYYTNVLNSVGYGRNKMKKKAVEEVAKIKESMKAQEEAIKKHAEDSIDSLFMKAPPKKKGTNPQGPYTEEEEDTEEYYTKKSKGRARVSSKMTTIPELLKKSPEQIAKEEAQAKKKQDRRIKREAKKQADRKEELRKKKVDRLIEGKPNVMDVMKGGNVQKRIRDEALSLLKDKSITKKELEKLLKELVEQVEEEDEDETVRQSEARQQGEDQQGMMGEDVNVGHDTMANFDKLNQMKEGVNMMMEDVNRGKYKSPPKPKGQQPRQGRGEIMPMSLGQPALMNVKSITRSMNLREEQKEREGIRRMPVNETPDITDPTSGESNVENIQMAISEQRNRTGEGIHVDPVMRNELPSATRFVHQPEDYSIMNRGESKSDVSGDERKEDDGSGGGGDQPFEYDDIHEDIGSGRLPELRGRTYDLLHGQTQEQHRGGRQRFHDNTGLSRLPRRAPRPEDTGDLKFADFGPEYPRQVYRGEPEQPQQPVTSGTDMTQTQYGNLTVPQEVERSAGGGGGDGRLGIVPSAVPQMDIENETIKRNKKTIQQLKTEINCFKAIYKDKIKTKRFKQLLNIDLKKKSLDDVRKIHKHFTEEVRDYYNSHRGLRVGVIVDPAILGLNVQALQGMIAPRVPSYAPTIDAGRRQEGFQQGGSGELRRGTPAGQKSAIAETDVHYKLGGMVHATGKYSKDIDSLNNHIDKQEDKKMSNFGRGSTRFGKEKRFKNTFYQVPKHTNISSFRIKTK